MIGVIADDLAGATLCGAILRRTGLRTVVVNYDDPWPERPEAIVVNVDTRLVNVETRGLVSTWKEQVEDRGAYRVQQAADNLVFRLGCTRLELRVDGGLRRDYSSELRGLIRGARFVDPIVFAVPAYPAAGRITTDGQQVSFIPGDMSPEGGRATERVVEAGPQLFGEALPISVPREVTHDGAQAVADHVVSRLGDTRNVLAEADSTAQLRVLAEAARLLESARTVVTMSSGAWLQFHPATVSPRDFVLVAMGLPTTPNEAQLKRLLAGRGRRLVLPHEMIGMALPDGDFESMIRSTDTIIVKAQPRDETRGPTDDGARLDAASDVAASVELILEKAHRHRVRCRGIVATGDYTVSSVLRRLSATAIEPVRELLPHAVEGRVSGGPWTGLPIIMKGGSIGGALALCDLVEVLQKKGS